MSPEDFFPNRTYLNASGSKFDTWFKNNILGGNDATDEANRLTATKAQVDSWWHLENTCEANENAIIAINAEINKQKLIVQNPNASADQKRVATRFITAYAMRIEEYRAQKNKLGCGAKEQAAQEQALVDQIKAAAPGAKIAGKTPTLTYVAWGVGILALGTLAYVVYKKKFKK
jgi:DNA gyrase/topoisomerase IV subunit A